MPNVRRLKDLPESVRYEIRLELKRAVDTALAYDFLQHRESRRPGLAGIVNEHFTRVFLEELLIPRRVADDVEENIRAGYPTSLVGAPGSGKSMIMLDLERRFAAEKLHDVLDPTVATFETFVFNGNQHAAILFEATGAASVQRYIQDTFARNILQRYFGSIDALPGEWLYQLASMAHEFIAFIGRFDVADSSQLGRLIRSDLEAGRSFERAHERFAERPAVDRLAMLMGAMSATNHHVVFLVDNVDPLPRAAVQGAADATFALTSMLQSGVGAVIAIRPSTRARVRNRLELAHYVEFAVHSFDEQEVEASLDVEGTRRRVREDLSQVLTIFNARLQAFDRVDSRELLEALGKRFAQEKWGQEEFTLQETEVRALIRHDIAELRRHAQRVFRDYFAVRGQPTPHRKSGVVRPMGARNWHRHNAAEDLTTVFVDWHNGSLRELARSLSDYVSRFWTEPDEMFRAANVREARTALFRHVLFFNSELHGSSGARSVHPSIPLFEPLHSGLDKDFSFLRARVLQYLAQRRRHGVEYVELRDLRRDVGEVFDVSPQQLDLAVWHLSERLGYEAGLLRVDPVDSGAEREETRLSERDTIELLPAGWILIERVCKVVEYMYWTCANDELARKIVCERLTLPEDALDEPARFNADSFRVDVALAYVAHVQLPRFQREHPYLRAGHRATVDEARRLKHFCNHFGFGEGNWFLGHCLDQIFKFVHRRIAVSSTAREDWQEVEDACVRLDAVLREHRHRGP